MKKMMKFASRRSLALPAFLSTILLLSGCSLAPRYERPSVPVPVAFKESRASFSTADGRDVKTGSWKLANPSENLSRGEWWTVFQDSSLDQLETRALTQNQTLKAAAARLKEARAINQSARAGLFPTLDAGFGPTREKVSPTSQMLPDGVNIPQQTLWRAEASASYEVDLFGRVASTLDAAKADTQQSEALYRSVMLALQTDVAQNYFSLRELDAEVKLFASTVDLRQQALKLVNSRFLEGEISELDVSRAKTELATAQSELMGIQRSRSTSEHRLAVLLGATPADFSFNENPISPVIVDIPPGLPSTLLERRPDIAAAERAMAAANARIGIAKAAFFPSLTLTGSGGFEAATLGDLLKWSSRTFLLGPFTGTALNLPLFDGGRRKGNLANARAEYEEDVANYRQQVLVAFRDTEDSLSDLRILAAQTATESQAVQGAARAAQLSRSQYTDGEVTYLDVIDAERTVLQSRRTAVQLEGLRAASTVSLIRALGGGWDDTSHVDDANKTYSAN